MTVPLNTTVQYYREKRKFFENFWEKTQFGVNQHLILYCKLLQKEMSIPNMKTMYPNRPSLDRVSAFVYIYLTLKGCSGDQVHCSFDIIGSGSNRVSYLITQFRYGNALIIK